MPLTHVLFESASGYAVFEVKLQDALTSASQEWQDSITDFAKFSRIATLLSFSPFKSAAHALENANDISEGWPFVKLLHQRSYGFC